MCVAIAATKIAVVASAPITVGSGTSAPRKRTESGTRNGRSRSGFEKRSFSTASGPAGKGAETPKLKGPPRKPNEVEVKAGPNRRTIEIDPAATTVSGE